MTYFKLDIPKVNESISAYRENKKNCLDDINTVYSNLGYTESAWNDSNAYNFIEKVKKDKYNLIEYFNYLDRLYEEISQFKSNVNDICKKQDSINNLKILKFDDSEIETCKKYLNDSITLLNDSLNRINISSFDSNFEYIGLLYDLRSEIRIVRNSVKELIENINNFVSSINNEIYDSKYRLKRIGNFDFNLKTADYNWKVVNLNNKKVVNKEVQKHTQVNGANINLKQDSNNISVNKEINTYNVNAKNIDLEETEKIKDMNTELFYSSRDKVDINLKDNIDPTVKSVNVESISLNNNEIELNLNRQANNLSNSIKEVKANENEFSYSIDKNINVSKNIDNYQVNKTNINMGNIVDNSYDFNTKIEVNNTKPEEIIFDINDI